MINPDLVCRAEAAGIAPVYQNWRGETVEVSEETLAAILAALNEVPELDLRRLAGDAGTGDGGHEPGGGYEPSGHEPGSELHEAGSGDHVLGSGGEPPVPVGRSWGFTVQLYSVRSRGSWGHGDLRDLADLAAWSARELAAGFVLVNPLHAAEPLPPVSASPYLPMSRRFVSPLYLRIEDIPEYQLLPERDRARIAHLAAPLRAQNATSDLIDRDAVWTAKRAALEIVRTVPLAGQRLAAYQRFCEREGSDLQDWAAWCALSQLHGPDWRKWPDSAKGPRLATAMAAAGGLGDQPAFHAWLQWLLDEQLAAAQQEAKAAGMDTGIIHDLAVGVNPAGADAWAQQDLLVPGLNVGAPPDGFNQRGQDWAQPPWHPQRLASARYRPLANLFGAALRYAGGLRVDHVMGLRRLWCVPAGRPPDCGAYVQYDYGASIAALADEAARAGALPIGEDLGTVEPWFRSYLADHGILGTSLLWFAREPDGTPLRPEHWRRACMATVGTHDVPPVSGFLTGEQVAVRARLGLLKVPEDAERATAELMLSRWRGALTREGLIGAGSDPDPADFTVALYAFLAKTPAALIGVSLADAVGDSRTQNIPGTSDEYPNWRVPLCDSEHRAVLLEDLPSLPLVQAVAQAAAGRR